MKHPLIPLLVSVIIQFGNSPISSAAVPLKWTVETSSANPATFDQFAGATYDLEATLQSRGKPLAVTGDPQLFWQTNGMGSAWWSAPASITNLSIGQSVNQTILKATWTPACDVGARVYNCFIGITGTVYNAAFQLRLRPSPGALPNELPLPTPVIDFAKVTVLNPPWSGGGSGGVDTNAVLDIIHKTVEGSARYTPKYLWVYDCYDTYPEDAAWYYAQPQPYGSCSAVRDGGFLYRNYDWHFDSSAEFVVRVSGNADGRFASVGVANCGTNLTEAFVTSGKPSRYYKCLPGRVVDGINENGVVCEVNVVDGEPQWRSGVLTASDIHPLAAVRWALDNGTSAGMVASNLAARIMFPSSWTQNFHWMVADETSTYIVENGAASNVTGRAVMTNFRLYPTRDTSGAGQERYDLLLSSACCITNAWYTRAYRPDTTPPWVSEFGGDSDALALATNLWARAPKESHRGETFNGQSWWQTVHCSIYDITNRVLRIAVQETPDWYTFALPGATGVPPVGVDTNDVKALINSEVGGTNAVKAAVSAVPGLSSSVSSHASQLSQLSQAKRDKTDFEIFEEDTNSWCDFNSESIGTLSRTSNGKWEYERWCLEFVAGRWHLHLPDGGGLDWFSEAEEDALVVRFNEGITFYREAIHPTVKTGNISRTSATSGIAKLTQGGVLIAATDADVPGLQEAKDAANEANVWSAATYNFMTGGRTNCWFSGTNYVFGADAATRQKFAWEDGMDAATVPCSMALWEIRDGARQLVWDQRDWTAWYWSFKAEQMASDIQERIDALGNAVTNAANYAWAKRYASDGTPNPDASTTFIDTPSVTLSPGMKWETVATVSGASYWTIVGNGAVIGGTGTNAVLRIMDFEGNDIMTVTKGEHRLAWLEHGDITDNMYDGDGWVCFDMLADAEPVGYFSTTLDSSDFLPQADPSCPAQYSWENIGGGKYRVHFLLKPGIQANACFAKFQVEVEGQTVIRYNAGQEISGGLIYNGVKIAPDVSGSPAVGTVIQWKVVH